MLAPRWLRGGGYSTPLFLTGSKGRSQAAQESCTRPSGATTPLRFASHSFASGAMLCSSTLRACWRYKSSGSVRLLCATSDLTFCHPGMAATAASVLVQTRSRRPSSSRHAASYSSKSRSAHATIRRSATSAASNSFQAGYRGWDLREGSIGMAPCPLSGVPASTAKLSTPGRCPLTSKSFDLPNQTTHSEHHVVGGA